jgi:hypothetical protein
MLRPDSNYDHVEPCHVPAFAAPPGTPSWITAELIEQTIRVWQPYYEIPLTVDSAVTMILAVGRLFSALSRERDDETVRGVSSGE